MCERESACARLRVYVCERERMFVCFSEKEGVYERCVCECVCVNESVRACVCVCACVNRDRDRECVREIGGVGGCECYCAGVFALVCV